MLGMNRLKIATKLHLLVVAAVLGLMIVGGVSYWTIDKLRVGGPLHAEMAEYRDLNGDIVAPALDLERVRYATLKLLVESKEQYSEDVALFHQRKKEYVDANEAWKSRISDGRLRELIGQAYEGGQQYIQIVEHEIMPAIESGNRKAAEEARIRTLVPFEKSVDATRQAIEVLHVKQVGLDERGRNSVTTSLSVLTVIGFLICAVVGFLGLTISRKVSSGTAAALSFANAIAAGDLGKENLETDGQDELANLGRALTQMKDNLRERTAATARMVGLADRVPFNVMFADLDLKIQYMNPASLRTLETLEKYLPVRSTEIIGQAIDIFHKDPRRVRRILSDLRNLPHNAKFAIGPETVEFATDAIYDGEKKHIGYLATWAVATERIRIEATNADYAGQIAAIGKSQAVIEFSLDGTILSANENFLRTLGYSFDEIKGKHQSMFVDPGYRESSEYKEFWAKLNRGEYVADEFKRVGKCGREVWIQASYNPIMDAGGKPIKVVKYATNVTPQKHAAEELKRKVDGILSVVSAATHGDLTQEISVSGQDAIGQMGEGLNHFFKDLRQSVRLIVQSAHSLATASEELSSTSQQMSANAEETSAQANVVSASAEQVNRNLQTVATGTEEMSNSIKEIAKNAHESAKVATGAVRIAEETNQIVSKLGDSSTEIGQVVKVITSIAQQTNLLALNATIEAARAGEAGKGFAVVANEVKELAKQTAKATEDISRKIEAIQGDTKNAVGAIGQISGVIRQVNDISNTIATAVEEQNATTNEMARNVGEAARGSGEISCNISGVAEAAKSTTHGANDSLQAAQCLAEMSTRLQELVSQFRIEEGYPAHPGKPQVSKATSARAGT
jgi:methyl-accepting chemotaxis protein